MDCHFKGMLCIRRLPFAYLLKDFTLTVVVDINPTVFQNIFWVIRDSLVYNSLDSCSHDHTWD